MNRELWVSHMPETKHALHDFVICCNKVVGGKSSVFKSNVVLTTSVQRLL